MSEDMATNMVIWCMHSDCLEEYEPYDTLNELYRHWYISHGEPHPDLCETPQTKVIWCMHSDCLEEYEPYDTLDELYRHWDISHGEPHPDLCETQVKHTKVRFSESVQYYDD